jgi:hypothetical protein
MGLYVAEGWVQIDGADVVEVEFTIWRPQQLRGVYAAMNRGTKVAWTTKAPALGNTWTTLGNIVSLNPPCLFVQVLRLARLSLLCLLL